MASFPMRDLVLVEQTWRLITVAKRPYWELDTLKYVERIVRPSLLGRFTDEQITSLVAHARNTVAMELGLPPWNE